MTEEKRQGGQIIDDKKRPGTKIWLVLSESKGKEGVGYKHSCGAEIVGATVAHPIHDGPFALSGGGDCNYQIVPFCPICEIQPNYHGAPIDHDPVERKEIAILKRIAANR